MFNRFKKQVQDDQGKIKLGTRVIRGPDWNHKCEDNGEGFLGTIVAFDEDKRLIEVIWDSGRRGHYRADPEKYDLRMFDNAPTGELHHGTVCHYCSDRPIHGMKWTCKKCNIDMCTQCYINDKHDEAHGLERTDTLESKRYKTRPGNSFKERVVIKGIFEGAEVVAGPNSKHDFESDGGDVGYVEKITSWKNKYHRGIVSVFWKASNRTQFYRLGAEGCVDVFCSRLTETASGGTCYLDNLPVVDLNRMSTETPDLVPRTSDGYFEWQLKHRHETVTFSKDSKRDIELELPGPVIEGNVPFEGAESYSHFESTVMLVGAEGTGKTCIARYLIGKQPTRFRMSTDGIVLYNGLAYMNLETKEWLEGNQATVHKRASIIIWDFGGMDVFYSTHQMFLTYRAIYIIVLDGSRELDDPCSYERYLPGRSGHKSSRDYLLFWISTIVTYCRGSIWGYPKILVVLTHKDQVLPNAVDTRLRGIFGEIYKMFDKTPLMQHLVIDDEIFLNAKDKHDPEMAKIKSAIIRESERQPKWGEPLPKCFIPLELELASLIKRKIPFITLEHLKKINSRQPIRPLSEAELKAFLKFQHSIGKILYFDGHKLDDRIILSPTVLIDAFKSIVTDRRFCEGNKKREEIWDTMGKKGVVSKQAIESVWKGKKYVTFYKDKEYLLNVMTHLDILVEPKRYNSNRMHIPADFYYVASMVQTNDDSGYLQTANITNRNIAIAFLSSSMIIPPAISFRFISYCIYVWALKTYGDTNKDMLFHRSGLFTIDPSLDMYITCKDEMIIARLVHVTSNTLIMRDVASSICECLTSALEKISQLYIETSSDQTQASDASFMTRICCNSPDNPCLLPNNDLANTDQNWICPKHSIEHSIYTITSWIAGKDQEQCKPGCSVTNEIFLRATPSDLHLRRLSLMYRSFAAIELAIHLGFSNRRVETIMEIQDPRIVNFEILRQCRDSRMVTFKDIKEALERIGKESIHILCKLVKGQPIDFDMEPEKWDLVPTDIDIDRLAPLVGKNSLSFLIELGMDFHSWVQISHRQNERDLVRLNQDILEEWRFKFCRMHNLKPTLREIARAFSNVGKNVKIVDNTLSDLF